MAQRSKGSKTFRLQGPGAPRPGHAGAGARVAPGLKISVREIARQYGGTPEHWAVLIRSGAVPGSYSAGLHSRASHRAVRDFIERMLSDAAAAASKVPTQPAKSTPPRKVASKVTGLTPRRVPPKAAPLPAIVLRDGVAYIEGTSVPVRQLERARRAGSTEADLHAVFPDLPPRSLDAVARYVRSFPETVERWADLLAPAQTSPGEEEDDGAGFDAELEGLLDSRAELFRRLAQ
jgi:uncharacterized protein (DUF433 family)